MKKPQSKTFLSYMGVGPIRPQVYSAMRNFLDDYVTLGTPEVIEKYQPYVGNLSEEAARLLKCEPSEIIYVKNTGDGLLTASDVIPLESHDEILVLENEYPANLLPWLKKGRDGVSVKVIPGRDNAAGFRKLLDSIGPRTKVVSIAWIQCYDGFVADMEELSVRCRERGIFLVVDAVQAVGVIAIDLKKVRIDFLVCGGQKYLGSIGGLGFMYVNAEIMPKLLNSRIGIRSVENFSSAGYTLKAGAARFQDGTENLLGIVGLTAALKEINRVGITAIEKKNRALRITFKKKLRAASIAFIDHEHQGNIISIPEERASECVQFMRSRRIYVRAMKDVVRASFSYDTKTKSFDTFVKAMIEWRKQLPANKTVRQPQSVARQLVR